MFLINFLVLKKSELRFCADSNPARGRSEIRDGEDLRQWSRLEIRLDAFCRSTIPQKQFIITITLKCQGRIQSFFGGGDTVISNGS